MFKHLTIKPNRLINTIHETAKWGAHGVWGLAATETGVCRLTLSDLDKSVREWFISEVKLLGCSVKIDKMGNIFAVYPGENEGLPTAMGSHLDTQPTGGRYDGILGVLSGLEVLRTIHENGFKPKYPIALIDWTNEEGARFPVPVMSSQVWADLRPLEEMYQVKSITDDVPVTFVSELERIGFKGDIDANYKVNPIKCHFEIHIEQGPILEQENKKIGVVIGAQAYNWTRVTVKGKATHTGTTPMNARSDALLAASRMISTGNEIGKKHNGLLSVGALTLLPNVCNVIPDTVEFTVDCRHAETKVMHDIIEEYKAEFAKIAKEAGNRITLEYEHLVTTDAVQFHETCIDCVRTSAVDLFGEDQVMEIRSGASHDSCATVWRVPTSMIFIPSKDGVSHNPEEYSTPEQVAEGLQVLLNAVLKYDSLRTD